jgi:hypothetical protein
LSAMGDPDLRLLPFITGILKLQLKRKLVIVGDGACGKVSSLSSAAFVPGTCAGETLC